MAPEPLPRLSNIFSKSDTFEYGGFRVEKKPGAPWNDARAFFESIRLTLQGEQKRVLAFMIVYQGTPIPTAIYKIPGEYPHESLTYQINKIKTALQEQAASTEAAGRIAHTPGWELVHRRKSGQWKWAQVPQYFIQKP